MCQLTAVRSTAPEQTCIIPAINPDGLKEVAVSRRLPATRNQIPGAPLRSGTHTGSQPATTGPINCAGLVTSLPRFVLSVVHWENQHGEEGADILRRFGSQLPLPCRRPGARQTGIR